MTATLNAARLRAESDARVLSVLELADSSRLEIVQETGVKSATVEKVIKRLREEGRIRIASYERTNGYWRPIYGLGNSPDAKPPKRLTVAQRSAKYRRENLALRRAKDRVTTGFAAFYLQLARTS
jgi:biotin operon repressor